MSELVGRINRHSHDPAAGEMPVKWNTIENRPTPGEVERVHTVEFTNSSILQRATQRLFPLPGVARFNLGYGLTALTLNNEPLRMNTDWFENPRPINARRDETSAYWTQCIEIALAFATLAGTFRLTWIEREIFDTVRGIREARLDAANKLLWDGKTRFPLGPAGENVFPNGVAWDPIPAGYKVEVWRKTSHKQNGDDTPAPGYMPNTPLNRQSGVRWMLYHVVESTVDGINLDFLRRLHATPSRGSIGTEAYRFAYLRPDGARSLLSLEVAVYHGRPLWGQSHTLPAGRVRIK